jgi:hypothetical protein
LKDPAVAVTNLWQRQFYDKMMLNRNTRIQIGIGVIAIIIIFLGIIFCSGRGFVPDEGYYQLNVDLLRQYGFSDAFLVHLYGPAGPTYGVLHYILYPLTHGNIISVRLVNLCLVLCAVFLINKILLKAGLPVLGWALMAIPMSFVCGGLALTEMPALVLLLCCILFMLQFNSERKLYQLVLAGICYSCCVLGRQPYLLLFPVFIFLLFYPFRKADIHLILIFSILSLAFPIHCFLIWKGLIPVTGNFAESGGLVYNHFFLACGYCMMAFLFTIPGFIVHPRRFGYSKLIIILVGAIILSLVFKFQYAIMKPVAIRLLPPEWFPFFLNVSFGFLIFLSIYFIGNCLIRYHESNKDKFTLMAYLSMFALLISTISITHQFSSRYVFQLVPFVFIAGAKFNVNQPISNILRTIGLIMGTFALFSYYYS